MKQINQKLLYTVEFKPKLEYEHIHIHRSVYKKIILNQIKVGQRQNGLIF